MSEYGFEYEVKRFSNKASEAANPQTRSISIIVSFNSIFQGTDYQYVDIKTLDSKEAFESLYNTYLVAKKISIKDVVVFPLYLDDMADITPNDEFVGYERLCGFAFFLKKDLRQKYNIIKITKKVETIAYYDLMLEMKQYNSFLNNDVWLIVVSKPHGRNFVVYGRERIEDKLFEINKIFKKEKQKSERNK